MKRLYSKYSLVAGVCLLTLFTLISWQAVQADWVYRLFDRVGLSLSKAQPEPTATQAPSGKARSATFARVTDLAPGNELASQPVASVLADLNGDGRSDLVTAYANSLVTVRAGLADGPFGAAQSFSIDAQIGAMAAGDFTGDGHLDLLVTDAGTETLLVLVGDGRGGLPEAQRVKLVGAPSRLLVKDFMGDQRAEVVVAVTAQAKTELLLWQDIAWLHPMSEAALREVEPRTLALNPARLAVPWQGTPSQVDVGYVDSDSYADILVIGEQQISALYGDRTAPFGRHSTVTLEQPHLASVVGDFDGDVRAEVAVLDSLTRDVIIYNNPTGEWGVRERLNVGVTATALAAADLGGDRVSDLVVMRPEAGQVAILPGARQGRLGGEQVHTIEGAPVMALPAYLDKDELTDLIIIKQRGVSLLLTTQAADRPTEGGVGDSPITAIDPLEYDIQVPEGECRTVPITITIAPTVFRPLDIYLLVDATQSYNDNIANFVRDGERFVDDLIALRGDIRLGIGKFRDYPIRPFGTLIDFAYKRKLDMTQVTVGNRAAFVNAINDISSEGGGDDPEAQLAALFQAATGDGQTVPGIGRANIAAGQQASFRQNVDVEKIIVLLTDSNFHNAGDPGNIPYPGPSFADTIAALNARNIKVVGMAAGGPGGDASITINALRQIAAATNTRARRDIDCDGNGTIDILRGDPIVCPPPANGAALKDVILSVVRGFDLPVPLTLEIDRDCSPISFMIDPPVQFVDPLIGGTFTFNVTFCVPCLAFPCECRFETKVILDEIIRARIPSRVECVRPICEVSPPALQFGDVCVGASATQPITISNTGNGAFVVNAINSSNPAFSVASTSSPLPATVAPGSSLTANIQFTCTSGGPQDGLISFDTDPSRNCVTDPLCAPVPVSGFCVQITGDVTPRDINFGNLCVGQSTSQNFQVCNTGNRPFTVAPSSNNPAFTVTPASATIDPGACATFTVTFTCAASGPQSGAISFTTSNATNCPLDLGLVNLNGTCIQPVCAVAPTSLDFGNVCVGQSASQSFTVSNTGNADFTITAINSSNGAFSIVAPALPATVPAGGSVTVTVQFTCAAPGPQSGTISIVTDSVCGPVPCDTVTVSGTCLLITCAVSPTAIDFGDVCVGSSADQTFTVSNTGNAAFSIDGINSSNGAFTILSPALPVSVPAGGSVDVTVRLTCTTPGPQSGTISFNTSSDCGPVSCGTVAVSGFCVQITCAVSPASLDFGQVCVGQSADQSVTVSNTGNRPFTINAINSSNAAFSVVSPALPVTIPPGGSTLVTVRFTCTTSGAQSGTISFNTSSVCGPVDCGTVSVSGTCVLITCAVAPTSLNFGNVCVGASADQSFTVSNTGNGDFTINGISSSNGAFSIVSPALPVTVPVGGSVVVTVRLTCTTPGPQSGTISFNTSSACGPVDCGTVSVSGTCLLITCDVSPRNLDFGAVCVGATADRTFTVSNTGNSAFTINAINSSNLAFTIVSPALPVTVPPGGSVNVTVRLTCTASGPQSATISFSTSSACGPVDCGTVTVSGTCLQITGTVNPPSLNFGDVCVGASADQTFTITNTGNGQFTVTTLAPDNAAFTVVAPALPITLNPGESATVTVRFTCTTPGAQVGQLVVSADSACGTILVGVVDLSGFCVQVTCDVLPRTIDFGNICVGQSAEQGFKVRNTGNRDLTITAINTCPGFTIVSPALPVTIPAGGSQPVVVRLTCTTPGPQTCTISFVAQSQCGPVDCGTVTATGTCVQPVCSVAPTSLNFGSVCVGASADQTVTVSNPGNVAFTINAINSSNPTFSIVSPALPATVPAGGSVPVTVRFTCTTSGPQSGTISFVTDSFCGPVPCSPVSVSGTCVLITCAVSPGSLNFGDVCVGASADQSFTVNNTGNGDFTITAINSSNAAFSVLSPALPVTVPVGGSVTVTVRLTCTTPGPQSGAISFVTTSACGPVACGTVNLTGFCVQVACSVSPATVNFGDVCVGTSATQTFSVNNIGNRPFTITGINSDNPAFSIVSPALPATVPAGGSVPVTVRLTCTAPGPQAGTISFITESACGPVDCGIVALSGTCVQPVCLVAPASLNFGQVMAGASADQTLTVSNPGNTAFTINAIGSTNPAFSIVAPALPVTVPPGGSVTVTVRFTCAPGASGVQSGTITFSTSSLCGPVLCADVPVMGECFVGPVCVPKPASIDFGSVILNQTQQTGQLNPNGPPVCPPMPGTLVVPTFRINNAGDRCLRVTAALSDNPRFTVVTPLPIEIPAGGSAEIVLQFEAREVGPTSGTITFVTECCVGDPLACSNPPDCSITVSGTGLFGPDCIFISPLGTAPDFNFDVPFPDIVVGDMTTEGGLVQILNGGDQPLIINQGGQRPESTNLSFTVVGFDLDGIIPPLDLPLDPNPAVPAPEICILPGDSVFMLIKFTGLDIGEQSGAIHIFSNDPANIPTSPSCVLKNVRGRVVRPAQCQLTPNTLTLNAFAACTSAQETVTVANIGDLGLVISNITTTNPEIQVIDPLTNAPPMLPITVSGGGARQFLIRCTPLSEGTRTATIRFITNDPNPLACVLNVTCVATRGPICEVAMPDVVNGAPDGRTYGEVVIVPVGDPLFGTVGPTGLPFGEKRLPIEVRNVGDAPLELLAPPAPFTSNPFVTNNNFIVEGFMVGQVIPPGGVATGTVIFRPTLRQLQEGTIRFFTNTCVGECVLTGVNGIGITNAVNKGTPSLNVGTALVGSFVENSFLMVNRGDRALVISDPSQIVIDNPVFSVVTPLPIIVPPEFQGGGAGLSVTVRFTPTVVGQQIGRITFNYSATDIGPVLPFTLNVSGTGTTSSSAVSSQPVEGGSISVPVTGGTRPVVGNEE